MEYEELCAWFEQYTDSFMDDKNKRWMEVKKAHTFKVIAIAERLAQSLGLDEQEVMITRVVALLHDIARFRQMREHGTFRDEESVDHGLLGLRIIDEESLLIGFSKENQEIIKEAVKWHNKPIESVPSMQGKKELQSNIIRDADKIDIIRIQLDLLEQKPCKKETLSDYILNRIQKGEPIVFSLLKSRVEIYVACLNWIHELHYQESIIILQEQGFYEKLAQSLPIDDQIKEQLIKAFKEKTNSSAS